MGCIELFENFSAAPLLSSMNHLSDHDLERYHLGMIVDEVELAPLEEHILGCPECAERAEQAAEYVDTLDRKSVLRSTF